MEIKMVFKSGTVVDFYAYSIGILNKTQEILIKKPKYVDI